MNKQFAALVIGWTTLFAGEAFAQRGATSILFYNANTGSAAVGHVDLDGHFKQLKGYVPGSFSSGWTQITPTGQDVLFYNGGTGSAAAGHFDQDGTFRQTSTYL